MIKPLVETCQMPCPPDIDQWLPSPFTFFERDFEGNVELSRLESQIACENYRAMWSDPERILEPVAANGSNRYDQ